MPFDDPEHQTRAQKARRLLTKRRQALYLDTLKATASRRHARKAAGNLHPSTLYLWRQDDDFCRREGLAEAALADEIRDKGMELVRQGNPLLTLAHLNAHCPEFKEVRRAGAVPPTGSEDAREAVCTAFEGLFGEVDALTPEAIEEDAPVDPTSDLAAAS